jgi:phage terminase large subunit GpA-like protein
VTLSLRDGATLRGAFLRALRPPPLQTVSEWADANRVLPSSSSAEPGPWRTDRVPYLREVMDGMDVDLPDITRENVRAVPLSDLLGHPQS